MDTTITIGNQRPFTLRILGDQGSDLTSLFSGNVQFASDAQAISSLVGDATGLAGKAITGGSAGSVAVHATGQTPDGRSFAVDVTVVAVEAPPPLEQVASAEILFGGEEPLGT